MEYEEYADLIFSYDSQITYESKPRVGNCDDDECIRKDRHNEFIPVNEFNEEHLPLDCRDPQLIESIRIKSDLTVKAIVGAVSLQRQQNVEDALALPGYKLPIRYGTGYIKDIKDPLTKVCPCPLCVESEKPEKEYSTFLIFTSEHVIRDDLDAKNTIFECSFIPDAKKKDGKLGERNETDGKPDEIVKKDGKPDEIVKKDGKPDEIVKKDGKPDEIVKKDGKPDEIVEEEEKAFGIIDKKDGVLYGTAVHLYLNSDVIVIRAVTHDDDLATNICRCLGLELFFRWSPPSPRGMIISHPHGGIKKISFGNILSCHSRLEFESEGLVVRGEVVKFRLAPSSNQSGVAESTHQSGDVEKTKEVTEVVSQAWPIFRSLSKWMRNAFKIVSDILNESDETSQPSESSEVDIQTGKIYSISPEFIVRFPYNDSLIRCKFEYGNQIWIQFPENSKFFSGEELERETELFFDSQTEFFYEGLRTTEEQILYRVTYDIPTCPGSEGALVIHDAKADIIFTFLTHCGSCVDGDNISCLFNKKLNQRDNSQLSPQKVFL